MQRRLVAVIAAVALGCVQPKLDNERPPATKPSESDVVGTWKLISITENGQLHPVSEAFYLRLYPDGTAATWPTPVAPVTHGLYKVENGQLSLPDASQSDPGQVRCTHDKLWFWNKNGECLYYRVEPDLEPGKTR
ncbi:MAG TPA: hypothetical protein VK797_04205 [Tepidisphaeraceae bacterium]|jgi:hypothetical protein|nr:hypothetical protein [Tepidisphaeraceae bacterium]